MNTIYVIVKWIYKFYNLNKCNARQQNKKQNRGKPTMKEKSKPEPLPGQIKAEVEIKTVTNMYTWMYASMN